MRPRKAFSKLSHLKKGEFDVEKFKISNPTLWKKLKAQFDTGRKIVQIQLLNGLPRTNEETLRYYLSEYAGRFLEYGPNSFPTSFNCLEPFFHFNTHNSIIELIAEEESYGVSLLDFLEFVTEANFSIDKIDFYENIPEKIIYHFSFTSGYDEINFSNVLGKTFVVSGLSLVRQGDQVAVLVQAGESFDEQEAKNYFESRTKDSILKSITPFKKSLGMEFENNDEPKVVNFENRNDLWHHNVACLFDLKTKSIDLRYVARDENISFSVISDDFHAIFGRQKELLKDDIKSYFDSHLKQLSEYDAVFDFVKYCLCLPFYVFEKEERLVDVSYETGLNTLIRRPLSKKDYVSVPGTYKTFAKPFYYLESNNQAIIKNDTLDDNSFRVEKSGYWKRLEIDENGFDKSGNPIIGKTWVERNDIYYSIPKGATKVDVVNVFNGENAGYIYIMRQPAYEENIFKIGLTKRDSEIRSKELSNTSSADRFFVINSYHTKDCIEAEKQIHRELESYRLTSRREFFRCDLKKILSTCERIVNSINL